MSREENEENLECDSGPYCQHWGDPMDCHECNKEKFLEELEELTRKYNLEISGCGCCDSPRLDELENERASSDYGYILKRDRIMWEKKHDA